MLFIMHFIPTSILCPSLAVCCPDTRLTHWNIGALSVIVPVTLGSQNAAVWKLGQGTRDELIGDFRARWMRV